ncbi:MAG: serine/threonine protein kinase, partial [Sandaracinaceae bacterium]|nr:serine/threonine protein kinase [Sandaracinaceae bacterium]
MTSSARREAVGGELRAGIRIGDRYRLERRIAEGGMSVVWEATHLTLDRTVAVKFLDVFGRRAEEARERFLREARLVAAIRNRHVVDVIDFGTEPGGRPYMVMERLEGMTLAQRMERDPALTVGEVIEIIASVLTGLSAVHEAGIVHRDLKPENVFLVEDADGVSPKILDFGVSRAIEGELESVMPTLENAIVGTPQFMSPEQARGLRDIDHRTDLWSTGVMLFELLTGVLPFDAEVVGDILVRIATQEAPDLESLRPDLGEPFASVVRKALCRDRDRRWASAREMRGALLVAASETELRLDHVLSSGEGPGLDAELLDQSVVRARADMPTQEATDQA